MITEQERQERELFLRAVAELDCPPDKDALMERMEQDRSEHKSMRRMIREIQAKQEESLHRAFRS